MAQTFNNNNEMENYFNKVIEKAIEAVSNNLLKDFQEHIKNTIYAAKPGEYERYGGTNGLGEGGFGSGWKISDEQNKQIGDYVKALVFDGSRLIAPQNDMINSQRSHGDGEFGLDLRNMMMDILNDYNKNRSKEYSYNKGALYLQHNTQGYWDSYIINLDKKIYKWFDKELGKYGIKRG